MTRLAVLIATAALSLQTPAQAALPAPQTAALQGVELAKGPGRDWCNPRATGKGQSSGATTSTATSDCASLARR